MDYAKLGGILLRAREASKYTQKDIANELRITPQTVSNWERGTSRIEMAALEWLCGKYQISFVQTVSTSSDEKESPAPLSDNLTKEQREYVEKYFELNLEGRERVHATINFELAKQKGIRKSVTEITQKRLSVEIGASERGIQQYELGERKPTYDMLIALADYFDVSLDYLVGRSDNPERR